jgi:large subunit ribosomal protein L24
MRILRYRKTDGVRIRAGRHAIKSERQPIHVAVGDTVRVMRGDDAGKEGKVVKLFPKTGRILVEGINIVKKHRRAKTQDEQSQILEVAAPFASSNVMLIDPTSGKATRIRHRVDADGTKERISVKSGDALPRTR